MWEDLALCGKPCSLGRGSWTTRGKTETSTSKGASMHPFLSAVSCRCDMTSCLKYLLWLPHNDGPQPRIVNWHNLSPLIWFESWRLITATEMELECLERIAIMISWTQLLISHLEHLMQYSLSLPTSLHFTSNTLMFLAITKIISLQMDTRKVWHAHHSWLAQLSNLPRCCSSSSWPTLVLWP